LIKRIGEPERCATRNYAGSTTAFAALITGHGRAVRITQEWFDDAGAGWRRDDPDLITQRVVAHWSPSTALDPRDWMAVIATVLTMSATRAPRDRSLTGLFKPCRIGPIATAFALRCTAL